MLKLYLAGKISKNDWRHDIAPAIRDIYSVKSWREVSSVPTIFAWVDYYGPFFVACDHGCGHGPDTHGVALDTTGCFHMEITRAEVLKKSEAGIRACNLFVAYLGPDFATACGTMSEIGYAHALGKHILLISHPDLDSNEMWFVRSMATQEIIDPDPTVLMSLLWGVEDYLYIQTKRGVSLAAILESRRNAPRKKTSQ